MNLVQHLHNQRDFSFETFGPPEFKDHKGGCAHLRKEIQEAEDKPEEIAMALAEKLEINRRRKWPNWQFVDPEQAIEHVRDTTVEK